MVKKEIIIIADYTQETSLSLEELCEICGISSDIIYTFIDYEIVKPKGDVPDEWEFDLSHLQRVKTALRLKRDLEVNLPGIAIVLDLLDEMEDMQARLDFFENQFSKL